MKPYTYAFLAAAAACGLASAAETAYTTPVGYVSLGNTASPAVPAETDYFISLPLDRPTEAAGAVASIAGDVITLQGTPGLGTFSGGVPYLLKVSSGAKNGLVALITANTTSTVTVQVMEGDSLTGIVSGDTVSIQKAWTPLALAAGNSFPAGTQLLAYSGVAPGTNIVNDITLEFDGTSWLDLSTFGSADDQALYPGEGLILRTVAGAPVTSFVVSGEVPARKARAIISNLDAGGQDNFISYTAPVGERLDSSGLGFNVGDQILLFDDFETNGVRVTPGQNKAAARTLEYQGAGAWLDLATFSNVETTFFFQPGECFAYRVAAGAPLTDTVWSDEPAFLPSL